MSFDVACQLSRTKKPSRHSATEPLILVDGVMSAKGRPIAKSARESPVIVPLKVNCPSDRLVAIRPVSSLRNSTPAMMLCFPRAVADLVIGIDGTVVLEPVRTVVPNVHAGGTGYIDVGNAGHIVGSVVVEPWDTKVRSGVLSPLTYQ